MAEPPRAGDRRDEEDRREEREDREPGEHAPNVAHVSALALVEDRFAADGDVEVRWPDDKVGEDRIRRGAELVVGVAGVADRAGPALVEIDPGRRQERQDRHGHDDDRGRQGRQDRGNPLCRSGIHEAMVARRSPTAPASSLFQSLGLLPPALDDDVERKLHVELQRGSDEAQPEARKVETEDVAKALYVRLHQ